MIRFSVSMERDLAEKFDLYLKKKGIRGRSAGIRLLIREKLIEEGIRNPQTEVYGIISYIYDYTKNDLETKLTELQHKNKGLIIITSHIHLDEHNCLEMVTVKGQSIFVQRLAEEIESNKGIKNVKRLMTEVV